MMSEAPRAKWQLGNRALSGLLATAAASMLVLTGCPPEPTGTSSGSSAGSDGAGGMTGAGGAGTGGDASTGGSGGGPDSDAGWTEFTESPDTVKVYVSSSDGSDQNNGLSEATPVQTIAKGKSILREDHPDWLLLKRGDVWEEVIGTWSKSGKSAEEPMLVSYYGDPTKDRPLLKTGDKEALNSDPGSTVNHVAFVGLHFYAHTRDPDSADYVASPGVRGVYWRSVTDGLLFEDMRIRFYGDKNISINGTNGITSNAKVRRSVITDAYVITADEENDHSQGLYAEKVKDLLIEENVFDHNGWNEKVNGAKTNYNHNMYIHVSCENLIVKNNISVRAASHGLQARPGGIVTGNLFVDDSIALSYGYVLGMSAPKDGGVTGEVTDNVLLASVDIKLMDMGYRGLGMQLGNIKSAVVSGNIIAHDKSAKPYGSAIRLHENGIGIHDLTIQDNIVYDWRGNLQIESNAGFLDVLVKNNHFQSPEDKTPLVTITGAFPQGITFANNTWFTLQDAPKWFVQGANDLTFEQWTMKSSEQGGTLTKVKYMAPDRKISEYHQSIGKEADFDVFMNEARKQSRQRYLKEYTAKPVMDFIREGFQVVP